MKLDLVRMRRRCVAVSALMQKEHSLKIGWALVAFLRVFERLITHIDWKNIVFG